MSQSSPVLGWKRGIHGMAVALACAGLCATAGAQSFPSKPIRLIVPVPPGGGADFVARSYAAHLSKSLGQQIVVDNRGGAAGIIAMDAVAKAPADGYTLIQTNISTISINPFIYDRLPYDAQRDFAPVSITTLNPLLLVIHPGVAARSVKELIALAKARPGQLAYGSLGSGSIQHLAGHMFGKEAGISLVHVPYKGAAPVTVDLLAAQVQRLSAASDSCRPCEIRTGDCVGDHERATHGLFQRCADVSGIGYDDDECLVVERHIGTRAHARVNYPAAERGNPHAAGAPELNRMGHARDQCGEQYAR